MSINHLLPRALHSAGSTTTPLEGRGNAAELQQQIATLRAKLAAAEERERQLCSKSNGYVVENARLSERLAAAEARAERLERALKYIIDDLEIRSQWKPGDQKGVVDIGHGAYMQGKAALAEGEAG